MRQLLTLIALLVAATASYAHAQPALSDRVPGDAIIYVGWQGTDALGASYSESHLAAVLAGTNLIGLKDQTIPALLDKLPQDKPEEVARRAAIEASIPLAMHLWKRPVAVFIPLATDDRGNAEPKLGVICDAGESAASFYKSLDEVVKQNGSKEVKTAIEGSLVVLTIGYANPAAVLKPPAHSLRDAPGFASAMKQLDSNPAYAAYVDLEPILHSFDRDMAQDKDPKQAAEWPRTRDALGVMGLKRFAMTGSFAGKDWSTRTFLEAPAPRAGLLELLTDAPIRPETYALIPRSAAYAMVHQFDPGKVLAKIRAALAAGDAKHVAEFDKQIAQATQFIGQDIPALLEPMSDQWAVFTDASVGGISSRDMILVQRPDNPAKVDQGLTAMTDRLKQFIARQRNASNGPVFLNVIEQPVGENLTVHSVLSSQVQLSWAVSGDGKFCIGGAAKTVAAATRVGSDPAAGDFSRSEAFAAVLKRLDIDEKRHFTGFEFADIPQTARQQYMGLNQGMIVLGMLAAAQGIPVPTPLLPSIDLVEKHLSPAGSVTWVDDRGWHQRGVSPFPGSGMFSSQQGDVVAVGAVALGVSVALPSLNRARETANRIKCSQNMRQIAQACILYANDHKGKYPDSMGVLIGEQPITINEFTCPSGDISPPKEIATGAIEKQVEWIDHSSPYTYVGKGVTSGSDGKTLLMYEREQDHDGDGMNLLFADGVVWWEDLASAKKIIADGKRQTDTKADPTSAVKR